MRTGRTVGIAVPLLAAVLGASGCQAAGTVAATGTAATGQPAVVEPAADGGPARITLTERAEEKLGLATETVSAAGSGASIPFAAVVYDADGASWAFVRLAAQTYRRAPVAIARVLGDQAELTTGPPPGTEVVTVGAALLVGAEAGISGGE